MAEIDSRKEYLLNKRMTDFGLGGAFEKWFLRYETSDTRKLRPLEPAITLREFISFNQTFKNSSQDRLICHPDGKGFELQSAAYKKIKSFLLVKGFTEHDWIMLGTQPRQGSLFPFSFDKKSELVKKHFVNLGLVKPKSETFKLLLEISSCDDVESLTVADILSITHEDVTKVIGIPKFWKIDYAQIQTFRSFVKILQTKLRKMGFRPNDGPFMKLSAKKTAFPAQGKKAA